MGVSRENLAIYTDGGSRGNPGPAAIGVVIGGKEYGEYIGEATNNEAEYKAAIFALKKIKQIIGKKKAASARIEIRIDSELVARQMRGEYKILERELQRFFIDLWNLKQDFGEVSFTIIPRKANKRADRIVNEELDRVSAKTLF